MRRQWLVPTIKNPSVADGVVSLATLNHVSSVGTTNMLSEMGLRNRKVPEVRYG